MNVIVTSNFWRLVGHANITISDPPITKNLYLKYDFVRRNTYSKKSGFR